MCTLVSPWETHENTHRLQLIPVSWYSCSPCAHLSGQDDDAGVGVVEGDERGGGDVDRGADHGS